MVRLKTRYLLFEVLFPADMDAAAPARSVRAPKAQLDSRRVFAYIKNSVAENFGELGLGQVQASLALKYFSPTTLTGIVRVTRDHWRMLQASMTLIADVEDRPVIFRVIRVSGTIKKSEQAAIRRDKRFVRALENSGEPTRGRADAR